MTRNDWKIINIRVIWKSFENQGLVIQSFIVNKPVAYLRREIRKIYLPLDPPF